MTHTVLLVQPSANKWSRTYYDYESVKELVDGVCQLYEQQLRQVNPNARGEIQYDVTDLFNYVDQVPDMSCLVYDSNMRAYRPHDKSWIRDTCLKHLRSQAQ